MKQKAFFIIFKGLSVAKNCLRPESGSLNYPEEKMNTYDTGGAYEWDNDFFTNISDNVSLESEFYHRNSFTVLQYLKKYSRIQVN